MSNKNVLYGFPLAAVRIKVETFLSLCDLWGNWPSGVLATKSATSERSLDRLVYSERMSEGRRPLTGNVGLIASFALISGAVLKVLAVSRFDVTTALSIVTQSNPATILVGVLVLSFGQILFLVALLVLLIADRVEEQHPSEHIVALILVVITMALVVATNPLFTGAVYVFVATYVLGWWPGRILDRISKWNRSDHQRKQRMATTEAEGEALKDEIEAFNKRAQAALAEPGAAGLNPSETAVLQRLLTRSREMVQRHEAIADELRKDVEDLTRVRKRTLVAFPMFWAVVLLFFALTNLSADTPWLPAETFITASGNHLVGYELGHDGGQAVILRESDRVVVLNDVTSAMICSTRHRSDALFLSPLELLYSSLHPPQYTRC